MLKEINSGLWPKRALNAQQIAAGIRARPQELIDSYEMPLDSIMVALLGRNGSYRDSQGIARLLEAFPRLKEVELVCIDAEDSTPSQWFVNSENKHCLAWDQLVTFADIVYPDVIQVKTEVKEKKKAIDCPFG